MSRFNKTILAALVLNSSSVFAGSMSPVCMESGVTVPCAGTGWDIGIEALYLKPSYSDDLAWASSNENVFTSVTGTTRTATLIENPTENNPAWTWGFKLEASYHFSTGNDLNLNWYHLVPKTTNKISTSASIDTFIEDSNFGTTAISDLFSVKPSWDAVNLEFGQHVDVSQHKKIRFHGGVQYTGIKTTLADITTSIFNIANQIPPDLTTTLTQKNTSAQFYGFGPRIGADMSYLLINDLAMYANGAAAILTGSTKFTQTTLTTVTNPTDPNVTPSINSLVSTGSRTAYVPELEAKLGLTYTHAMNKGNLTLDAGYMWVNYFNAQTILTEDSNFGVQGPFLGLKWVSVV